MGGRLICAMMSACFLAGCADSETPGPDGRTRAAGVEELRQATRAYATSPPIRRVADYSNAVAQGLIADPLMARYEVQRVPLAAHERCVGGVVIETDGNNVYTQRLDSKWKPIRCEGSFRLAPPQ
jgi:hypothetical protein